MHLWRFFTALDPKVAGAVQKPTSDAILHLKRSKDKTSSICGRFISALGRPFRIVYPESFSQAFSKMSDYIRSLGAQNRLFNYFRGFSRILGFSSFFLC